MQCYAMQYNTIQYNTRHDTIMNKNTRLYKWNANFWFVKETKKKNWKKFFFLNLKKIK